MKKRKIPLRTCVVTGEKLDKRDLLRIVRDKDLNVNIDLTGKMNGRGAYIKKDVAVLEKAKQKKILERQLECTIEESVYDEIKNMLEK